ncbi:MAG: carbon monoxide dehydrogenase subunit G [Gammaproteobacteria bacterium]
MELNDQIHINAPRPRVFAALNDVDVLRQAIPGCESIEAISPTEFSATVSAKIGPLKARFNGQVALADIVENESYTLSGEGRGGPAGHAKVRSRVLLEDAGDGTLLHYDVKADIGGKLAQLGGALVQKTAEKLAGEFFQKFEEIVSADADSTAGRTPPTPSSPRETAANGSWLWLAAGVGALIVIAWLML